MAARPSLGYQVTIYNSDGTVNQTATAGAGTTTDSITGLAATATYTFGVSAVNAVGSSSSATAAVGVISADSTVSSTQSDALGVDMAVDRVPVILPWQASPVTRLHMRRMAR